MRLKDLLNEIKYEKVLGDLDVDIKAMSYDSRKVIPESLFFCIKGLRVDGHDFAGVAISKGARVLVVERDIDTPDYITKVFVKDSRIAMAYMARNYYGDPSNQVTLIGITGTNGKTSITHLLKYILEEEGLKVGLIGTITNMVGDRKIPSVHTTPESLELQKLLRDMVDEGVDAIVMEVSSHSLALGRVEGCNFDIGVFTNLSQDHLDFHKDMVDYRDAKARLFDMCKKAIINIDDENGRWIAERISQEQCTYGICKESHIYARDLEIGDKGVSFFLYTPQGQTYIDLSIPGIFSIYNALAAASVCYMLEIPLKVIKGGLSRVKSVDGRFELLDTGTNYSVILDYAHTPDGLENILKTAKEFTRGRVIILFGCGGDRDHGKRPIMGQVAGTYADFCIVTSDNPRSEDPMTIIEDILPGIKATDCAYKVMENRRDAIEYALLKEAQEDDIVILAGKGHETYQILGDKTIHFDEKEIVSKVLGRERV